MAQYFEVHPQNPQPRLLKQAVQILHAGGVAAIPTDSSYAFVCHLDDKAAAEQLRRIRGVDDRHHLTLLCRDLSELSSHARVDNRQYRLLKLGTPGPFTFILEATKEVPRRVSHSSRRTIGLRVPDHPVTEALLELLGYAAAAAQDGPAAVSVAAAFGPELVLLDLGLPGMDGYDVARALRADPRHAGVILVALTGWGAEQDRARTAQAGFDHHLTKPADPDDLLRLVEAWLKTRKSGPGMTVAGREASNSANIAPR